MRQRLLLAAATVVVCGCYRPPGVQIVGPSVRNVTHFGPGLEPHSEVFRIQNTTSHPIVVSVAGTSCHCLVAFVAPDIVPPHGTAEVTLRVDPEPGVTRVATAELRPSVGPPLQLTVRIAAGDMPPLQATEARITVGPLDLDDVGEGCVRFRIPDVGGREELTLAIEPQPSFVTRVESVIGGAGDLGVCRLWVKGTRPGTSRKPLRFVLKTRGALVTSCRVPLVVTVREPLRVHPTVVALGERQEAHVSVSSSGPILVEDRPFLGSFVTTSRSTGAGRHELKIRGTTSGARGMVVVRLAGRPDCTAAIAVR